MSKLAATSLLFLCLALIAIPFTSITQGDVSANNGYECKVGIDCSGEYHGIGDECRWVLGKKGPSGTCWFCDDDGNTTVDTCKKKAGEDCDAGGAGTSVICGEYIEGKCIAANVPGGLKCKRVGPDEECDLEECL